MTRNQMELLEKALPMIRNRLMLLVFAGLLAILPVQAKSTSEVHIDQITPGSLKVQGFRLNHPATVTIEAIGAGAIYPNKKIRNLQVDPAGMRAYGWILDQNSRQVVWRMDLDNTIPVPEVEGNRRFKGTIHLPAGTYEVYYYAGKMHYRNLFENGFPSLGRLLHYLLRGDSHREKAKAQWHLTVQPVDEIFSPEDIQHSRKLKNEKAIVALQAMHDSEFREKAFELKKPATVAIYTLGEAFDGEEFDYGWIVSENTGNKIWEAVFETSRHAGGALKNRLWEDTLSLAPGNYRVYYVTDDSHSPQAWNANPPSDPYAWGILLIGIPGRFDPQAVVRRELKSIKPIVELVRVGNNALVEETVKLDRPMRVEVVALGEGRAGEMYDYGWIEDLSTGKRLWQMRFEHTRHAGGALKNRLEDEFITLPAGTYRVVYRTDDSHAYNSWNARPPYNPTRWGITILPATNRERVAKVKKITRAEQETHLLANLVRPGNSVHLRQPFTLKTRSRVRVQAIGEGAWGEMYDYGWIENRQSGDVVWIMSYEETTWAGGAQKNRKIDTVITLDPGDYEVHFVTDDSHAYHDWNDDPPEEPERYGIRVTLLE